MPYLVYGKMDREDIYSVIAYIRSLPSIRMMFRKMKSNFNEHDNENHSTEKQFTQKPDKGHYSYGEYMVKVHRAVIAISIK
jgi:hypothetical protein